MKQFKYWLKLDSEFIFKEHINAIKNDSRFAEWIILYNKLILMNLTRENDKFFMNLVPFSAKKIADETNTDIEIVKEAIKYFCNNDLMKVCEFQDLFKDEVIPENNNFYGEYQNVYLDKQDYNKFLAICLDKNLCDEIINDLSEAIELKKYELYDEKRPHAHLVMLKRFYKYRIEKMRKSEKENSTSEWIGSIIDEIEKEERNKVLTK